MKDNTRFTKRESAALARRYIAAKRDNDVEKSVERATVDFVETALEKRLGDLGTIATTYPYNTDGVVRFTPNTDSLLYGSDLLEATDFLVLVEAKKDFDFSGDGKLDRAKVLGDRAVVLAQVIYYFRKIREVEGTYPSAVTVADNDELFVLSGKVIAAYLDKDYDWSIAPSSAGSNRELVSDLIEDKNVSSIYVYHIDKDFDFNGPADRLFAAIENTDFSKIIVTPDRLRRAFDDFNKRVFGGSTVNTTLQMSVFVQSLLGSENIQPQVHKPNTLLYSEKDKKGEVIYRELSASRELPLDLGAYQEFFEQYDRNSYTVDERKGITEIADTLIDDFDRRWHGDFWTPKVWVDEAHALISKALNEYELDANGDPVLSWDGKPVLKAGTQDWKDRYVTWDAACGSKNLTRDYKFGEGKLFLSTIHNEELAIAEDYNPEATAFQYDFLNDDIELHEVSTGELDGDTNLLSDMFRDQFKMPPALLEALRNNEPIVFFMNPPYGQATSKAVTGIGDSAVSRAMKPLKVGRAGHELYSQFIYRVQMLADTFGYKADLHFFFFNKCFLTGNQFARFLGQLNQDFRFEDGFMLNAGEFNGTSAAWGIIFTHWKLTRENSPQSLFELEVKSSEIGKDGLLATYKLLDWKGKTYPSRSIGDWISQAKKGQRDSVEVARVFDTGFYDSRNNQYAHVVVPRNFIGTLNSKSSNIQYSGRQTGLYSSFNSSGGGYLNIIDANTFAIASVVMAVRKSWLSIITRQNLLWVRDKDVFPAPSQEFQESPAYPGFVADCVVYSLFASGSNQTSLRNYEYGTNEDGSPRLWNIENQFFWDDTERVRRLATQRFAHNHQNTENFNVAIQRDLDSFGGPRFVHHWLGKHRSDLSGPAEAILSIANEILEESFKYRDSYAEMYPKYNLNTWDAGWLQLYKMCYSRDALPAAKENERLKELKAQFDAQLQVLGDSIAERYSEDTGF